MENVATLTHPSTAAEASKWDAAMTATGVMVNGHSQVQSNGTANGPNADGADKADNRGGSLSGIVPTLQYAV